MNAETLSNEESAKKGILALALSNGVQQLITWGLTLATIRLLLPEDYGLMALIESLSPYFAIVASFDLASWFIQKRGLTTGDEEAALTHGILLGMLACILLFCIAPLAARFYRSEELFIPLVFVGITFLFRGLGAAGEGKLKRELRFREIALVQLAIAISRGFIQLVFAYLGFGFWALVIGYFCAEVVRSLSWVKLSAIKLRFRIDKKLSRDALKFGLPSAGASLLWTLYSSSDNLFVGRMFGPEILGLYSMAYYLVDLPAAKINQVSRPVLQPYYAKLRDNTEELKVAFLNTLQGTNAVLYPCVAGIGIISHDLVPLVLGPSWKGLELPLLIMSLSSIIRITGVNVSPLLLSLGLSRYAFYTGLLSAILFPILVVALGTTFGISGVYASWFVFQPLRIAMDIFFLRKCMNIGTKLFLWAIWKPLFATLVMTGAGLSLNLFLFSDWDDHWSFLCTIIACITVYSTVLRLTIGKNFLQTCISFGLSSSTAPEQNTN